MYGKIFIKGIGYYFFAELLSLFLVFSLGIIGNIAFKALSVVCCAGIMICLVINFAINCQKEARLSGADTGYAMPAVTGISASFAYVVLYILLLLAKSGILPNTFYRIYKLLNASVYHILNFISSDITAGTLNAPDLVIMFLLTLVPLLTAIITYTLCRKGVIPEDFIFQKK